MWPADGSRHQRATKCFMNNCGENSILQSLCLSVCLYCKEKKKVRQFLNIKGYWVIFNQLISKASKWLTSWRLRQKWLLLYTIYYMLSAFWLIVQTLLSSRRPFRLILKNIHLKVVSLCCEIIKNNKHKNSLYIAIVDISRWTCTVRKLLRFTWLVIYF